MHQRKTQIAANSSKIQTSERSGSYSQFNDFEFNNSSASLDYNRNVAETGNSAELNGQSFDSYQTTMQVDPNLSDPLERLPLTLKVLKWQQSTLGKYIEFEIAVRFQEGPQTEANQWHIFKRFTNLVTLHEELLTYFTELGIQPPALPPQFDDRVKRSRDQNLTNRQYNIQRYLQQVLLKLINRAPSELLVFLQLHEQALDFTDRDLLCKISFINGASVSVVISRCSICVNQ